MHPRSNEKQLTDLSYKVQEVIFQMLLDTYKYSVRKHIPEEERKLFVLKSVHNKLQTTTIAISYKELARFYRTKKSVIYKITNKQYKKSQ